jgi:hypothetical protein
MLWDWVCCVVEERAVRVAKEREREGPRKRSPGCTWGLLDEWSVRGPESSGSGSNMYSLGAQTPKHSTHPSFQPLSPRPHLTPKSNKTNSHPQ